MSYYRTKRTLPNGSWQILKGGSHSRGRAIRHAHKIQRYTHWEGTIIIFDEMGREIYRLHTHARTPDWSLRRKSISGALALIVVLVIAAAGAIYILPTLSNENGAPHVNLTPQPSLAQAAIVKPTSIPTTTDASSIWNWAQGLGSSISTNGIETYIFQYTNEERLANGVSQLSLNPCLSTTARDHSADMAANDFFSHDNLRGEDPSERAARHGCPTTKPMGGGYWIGVGENIGWTYNIGSTSQDVARAMMDGWMNSPGHRQNILNPQYSSIGIGVAESSNGKYISTQDFL